MKRVCQILISLCFSTFLFAQATINKIELSTDNPMVTRVAIELSDKTEWSHSIDKDNRQVKVLIKNCDVNHPEVKGLGKSNLVSDLAQTNIGNDGNVLLTINGLFLIETMTLNNPFKIVIDLFVFKKAYSYPELLYQATFYEKSGLLNKAARIYEKMRMQFPENTDTNYYWGNLLIRQNKKIAAKEKLLAVAFDSKEYKKAQDLIAKLDGNETVEADPIIKNVADKDTINSIGLSDSISTLAAQKPFRKRTFHFFSLKNILQFDFSKLVPTSFFRDIKNLSSWFWLIIGVVALIILLVIYDIIRIQKRKSKSRIKGKFKVKADNKIKQDLIKKLREQGWAVKEISRELMITEKETQMYIKQIKKEIIRTSDSK